jgi:cob(I)alamin adenosyltransferase
MARLRQLRIVGLRGASAPSRGRLGLGRFASGRARYQVQEPPFTIDDAAPRPRHSVPSPVVDPIIDFVKIYTKTGDSGETALLGGQRVSKAEPRVAAYGDVDELNAWLGLARSTRLDDQLSTMVDRLQRDLFAIGARLADPAGAVANRVAKAAVGPDDIARLEGWIDTLQAELLPLRRFILAGGSSAGASLHVARTICRRAERSIVSLGRDQVEPDVLVYINRLSDLLFVMARAANRRDGAAESEW